MTGPVLAALYRHDGRLHGEVWIPELRSRWSVDVLDPSYRLEQIRAYVAPASPVDASPIDLPRVAPLDFYLTVKWHEAQAQLALGRRRFAFREDGTSESSRWLDGLTSDGRACSPEAQRLLDERRVAAPAGVKSRREALREYLATALAGNRWPAWPARRPHPLGLE